MLCGEGFEHRKQWIEERLEVLAGCFAVSVCSFAVLDNHLHVLVRLDPDEVKRWSDKDVVRHWVTVYPYPPKSLQDASAELIEAWISLNGKKGTFYRSR